MAMLDEPPQSASAVDAVHEPQSATRKAASASMFAGIQPVSVIRRPQRGRGPRRILRVALAHVLLDRRDVGVNPLGAQFQPSPARPFRQAGGNEQLRSGVRENHRADVAAVQHRAIACAKSR